MLLPKKNAAGLTLDCERFMEQGEFSVSLCRVLIDHISIINVHNEVHASAISEELPEVAGVILGLLKLLHLTKLFNQRTVPNAARSFPSGFTFSLAV